jgi:DNA-directed RNA polymerase alpha subunit
MNENAIVEELYGAIEDHGLMETLCAVFGKGCKIELGYTQKLCDTEVKDLDLSVRSYNALMRAGCHTVGQAISAINENKLMSVRNLGIKSVAEIRRFILEYGYTQASERRKKEFLHNLVKLNAK